MFLKQNIAVEIDKANILYNLHFMLGYIISNNKYEIVTFQVVLNYPGPHNGHFNFMFISKLILMLLRGQIPDREYEHMLDHHLRCGSAYFSGTLGTYNSNFNG